MRCAPVHPIICWKFMILFINKANFTSFFFFFLKAAKPVCAKQLTRLPYSSVYVRLQWLCTIKSKFGSQLLPEDIQSMPRDKQCPSLGRLSPDVLTYHHEAAVIPLGEANRWKLLSFSVRGKSDELLGLINLFKCIASYYTSRLHINGFSNHCKNMFPPIRTQL